MIVDLQVPEAAFRIYLTAMVDVIYENEIVSQGRDIEMEVAVQIIFRNLDARSLQNAKQKASTLLVHASNQVNAYFRDTLSAQGLKVDHVEALSTEHWDFNLQLPERKDVGAMVDVLG